MAGVSTSGSAAGGGSTVRFASVETITNITLPAATATLYLLDGTNLSQSESIYNSSNGRFTVPSSVSGTVAVSMSVGGLGDVETATNNMLIQIYKNGAYYRQEGMNASMSADRINMMGVINFTAVATDYFQIYLYPKNAQHIIGAGTGGNFATFIIFG